MNTSNQNLCVCFCDYNADYGIVLLIRPKRKAFQFTTTGFFAILACWCLFLSFDSINVRLASFVSSQLANRLKMASIILTINDLFCHSKRKYVVFGIFMNHEDVQFIVIVIFLSFNWKDTRQWRCSLLKFNDQWPWSNAMYFFHYPNELCSRSFRKQHAHSICVTL